MVTGVGKDIVGTVRDIEGEEPDVKEEPDVEEEPGAEGEPDGNPGGLTTEELGASELLADVDGAAVGDEEPTVPDTALVRE